MKDSLSTEWFASFCVMSEGSNPAGHAFLSISYYDKEQNKIILDKKVGFYSEKFPILGLAPMSPGKVLNEKAYWTANRKGLSQLTWPITLNEMHALTNSLDHDLNYTNEHKGKPHTGTQPFPRFNLFKNACKTYGIKKLESILNISLYDRKNTIVDFPKLSGPISPLRLKSNTLITKEAPEPELFWSIPMAVLPRENLNLSDEQKSRYQAWSRFSALYFGLKEIVSELNATLTILEKNKYNDHDYKEVNELKSKFIDQIKEIKTLKHNPAAITNETVDQFVKTASELKDAIESTQITIQEKTILDSTLDYMKWLLNALNPLAWINNQYPTLSPQGTLEHCLVNYQKTEEKIKPSL